MYTGEECNRKNPPKCPSCGAKMVLRTARKGRYKGRQFWGCSNYPRCKEIIDINTIYYGNTDETNNNKIKGKNGIKRLGTALLGIIVTIAGLALLLFEHSFDGPHRRSFAAIPIVIGIIFIVSAIKGDDSL